MLEKAHFIVLVHFKFSLGLFCLTLTQPLGSVFSPSSYS